ncbi:MAG: hypothetical protein A2937_00180 [Candidatus Yonathbacteria bacterium RIFCSPLOWO2_01_FULL_47_33b]|uniref:PsbP C-terminal domain-containing protein n=1 Tax=Candidatus Yonathbacteria bacterium RIFCSPLOWO2_01_FULL_47_33b TaxID=1802727 RepID=A0A1G2SEL7_9BACT|nr:MAG: hypothetical protein A2937_00180 [Candidatus Yonathbacteria bacterium RIFCSPLOWO2_01_FULL_47_33b]
MYILVAMALVVSVFFVFQKQRVPRLPNEVIKIAPEETLSQLTFPNNTLDTSDWETYRSEEFGFEVKYPEGWKVSGGVTSGEDDRGFVAIYDQRPFHGDDNGIYIFIKETPVNDYISKIKESSNYKKIITNNANGYVVRAAGGFIATTTVLGNFAGDNSYMFHVLDYRMSTVPGDYYEVLEQILLSFKLI